MLNLNALTKNQEHEIIMKLEGDEYSKLKTVACIHLGKFSEALKYVEKGSFEAAYIYYKLKKFKKALKIISAFADNKSNILKSQILYSMGYYNTAYDTLKRMPKDDEITINLQAMKSMAILTTKTSKFVGHKLWIKKRDELTNFDKLENYKFTADDNHIEFVYNKTFENADTAENYVQALENAKSSFSLPEDSIISKQIHNMEGEFDELDLDTLSKTQKEVVLLNMCKLEKVDNSIHYLKNYYGKCSDSEYNWLKVAKSKDFILSPFVIPPVTDNLKLLRIFIGLKNKSMSKATVLKEAEGLANENYKEIIKKFYLDEFDEKVVPKLANLTI